MASIKLKGDTSGEITISAPAVAGTTTLTLPATSSTLATQNALGVRNRIINGDMRIDQRNAGASVTANGGAVFPVDRWKIEDATDGVFTGQQVSDAPTGASYSLKVTITTADTSLGATQYASCYQLIEGYNIADLAWGTANAKTVTLSFWVKSSLTGTFGGSVTNSGWGNTYPFTYTISSANTWEQKTITISGSTTGTWLTTNGQGIGLFFGLGVGVDYSGTAGAWTTGVKISATGATSVIGTNSSTWQISLVQLEVGDTATPFEHRPYDMELARCQRYYEKSWNDKTAVGSTGDTGSYMFLTNRNPGNGHTILPFKVKKRANPTVSLYAVNTGNVGYGSNLDAGGADTGLLPSRIGESAATVYTTSSIALGNFIQFHYIAVAEL